MCAIKNAHMNPHKRCQKSMFSVICVLQSESWVDILIYHTLMPMIVINVQQPYLLIPIGKCKMFSVKFVYMRCFVLLHGCLHVYVHTYTIVLKDPIFYNVHFLSHTFIAKKYHWCPIYNTINCNYSAISGELVCPELVFSFCNCLTNLHHRRLH